ncbi:MAG: hypothetical protein MUP11_07915 [Anaerolineales bacterium]|nr:hypothetical protein [Anaerolineales bacterium]
MTRTELLFTHNNKYFVLQEEGFDLRLISAQYNRTQNFQKLAAEAGAEAFIPKDDLDLEVVKKWVIKANNETNTTI